MSSKTRNISEKVASELLEHEAGLLADASKQQGAEEVKTAIDMAFATAPAMAIIACETKMAIIEAEATERNLGTIGNLRDLGRTIGRLIMEEVSRS